MYCSDMVVVVVLWRLVCTCCAVFEFLRAQLTAA